MVAVIMSSRLCLLWHVYTINDSHKIHLRCYSSILFLSKPIRMCCFHWHALFSCCLLKNKRGAKMMSYRLTLNSFIGQWCVILRHQGHADPNQDLVTHSNSCSTLLCLLCLFTFSRNSSWKNNVGKSKDCNWTKYNMSWIMTDCGWRVTVRLLCSTQFFTMALDIL